MNKLETIDLALVVGGDWGEPYCTQALSEPDPVRRIGLADMCRTFRDAQARVYATTNK